MTGSCVRVWVDRYGSYELAGTIEMRDVGLSFAYDPSFRGPAISAGMPLHYVRDVLKNPAAAERLLDLTKMLP